MNTKILSILLGMLIALTSIQVQALQEVDGTYHISTERFSDFHSIGNEYRIFKKYMKENEPAVYSECMVKNGDYTVQHIKQACLRSLYLQRFNLDFYTALLEYNKLINPGNHIVPTGGDSVSNGNGRIYAAEVQK